MVARRHIIHLFTAFLLLLVFSPGVQGYGKASENEDLLVSHEDAAWQAELPEDWSRYNYSSRWARSAVVTYGNKTYDPLSFKGGESDTYALAFHLSTEVAYACEFSFASGLHLKILANANH